MQRFNKPIQNNSSTYNNNEDKAPYAPRKNYGQRQFKLEMRAYFNKGTILKLVYEDYEAEEIKGIALGKEAGVVIVISKNPKHHYFSADLSEQLKQEIFGSMQLQDSYQQTRKEIKYISIGPRGRFFVIYEDQTWSAHGTTAFSNRIQKIRTPVRSVAFLKGDGWVIIFNDGKAEWQSDRVEGAPPQTSEYVGLFGVLMRAKAQGMRIRDVTAGWDGEWFVKFEDGSYHMYESQSEMFVNDVRRIYEDSGKIQRVEFGGQGSYVIFFTVPA